MKESTTAHTRLFQKIIFNGVRDSHGSESKRKIILFNIFSIVSIFFLTILGIAAFSEEAFFLGFADMVMALILLALILYLRLSGNQVFCSRAAAVLANAFFCYLFFTGGVNSTAFMWLYTYPSLVFFLLGIRGGSLASILLFLFTLVFLVIDLSSPVINVYTVDFAIRFLPSFLVVFFFSFLLEQSRADAHDALVHLVKKLKKNEAQLELSRDKLEERVAERTTNLLDINQKLQVEIETRQKAEMEGSRLKQELVNAQKMEMLGRLAGGVAHDLNNVLSGIVSYPDLLLMDVSPSDSMYNALQTIKKSGEKAAAIVQDLLALARRGVIVQDNVFLNDVLEEYFQSPEYLKLCRENPDVKVEQKLEPDLNMLTGSPVHLQKAVMNLVVNAFETIDAAGQIMISTENITLSSSLNGYEIIHKGEYVLFKISDNGVGMAADVLQRIFEPFYTRKRMGRSGTGLGMTVVWGTVKDHNGFFDIKSSPGKGTTFLLFFPAVSMELPLNLQKTSGAVQLNRGAGQTVLIVDDIAEQRTIGLTILEKLGYRAYAAASGEQAVDFISRQPVDLLLLDMIMEPGMDGLETYKRIVEIYPLQKAVIVSGFSENNRVSQALDLGIKAYLQKPYKIEQMNQILSQVLAE